MSQAAHRPLVVGNWKMHKTVAETRAFVRELRMLALPDDVEVVIAPPFTALGAVHEELHGTPVALGAQTMHESDQGPFTGEIAPPMLCELGVRYVVLGHSERRACGETDAGVNRKVRAAIAHGLTPIIAVGESATEHADGTTLPTVLRQVRAAFADVTARDVAACVVAYEPIWAIGTGSVEEPASVNNVIGAIRAASAGLQDARLLYGGSVNADNARALADQPHIDGSLVGGASLRAGAFAAIIKAYSSL